MERARGVGREDDLNARRRLAQLVAVALLGAGGGSIEGATDVLGRDIAGAGRSGRDRRGDQKGSLHIHRRVHVAVSHFGLLWLKKRVSPPSLAIFRPRRVDIDKVSQTLFFCQALDKEALMVYDEIGS